MPTNPTEDPCGVVDAIDTFGSRWKGAIVWWLRDKPQRFGELRRLIPAVSAKVLTQQLRQLEADGLVNREQFPEIPPRVEYSLTPLGQSVVPVLDSIAAWWGESSKAVHKSRKKAAADDKLR